MLTPAAAYVLMGMAGLIALHHFMKHEHQGKWVKTSWVGMMLGMAVHEGGLYQTAIAVCIVTVFTSFGIIALANRQMDEAISDAAK